ncbi:ClC family H(+)/Cl(-) exchange transporter [Clostridium tetani]|uniref:ClC family H(+)/Cl(-) exchange transporter n=1 Tax=Clostridium tetani TaxID=1513 RepID=UPI00100BE8F2|nr:ClC family H(+)/Cl(-) exchange transporter [Clostridium tetani]RXI40338.1 ClC family H(+)/Cl(-) exchange transporter [Clostridium tetani]
MEHNTVSDSIKGLKNIKFKLILESILVGLITGIVVVLFRILLDKVTNFRNYALMFIKNNSIVYVGMWFLFLIIAGIVFGVLIEKIPMIKGSGIPQVKGVFLRQLKMNWLRELVAKFFGGVASLGIGLSLGREGPSVQLGSEVGLGFCRVFKRRPFEEKYLITSGASAGLSAAFNAPLAGVVFSLEELHKSFNSLVLACAMGASLAANFISTRFLGLKPVFSLENVKALPLNKYHYLILLGIIIGISGGIFNYSILKVQDIYKDIKVLKNRYKTAIPFIVTGVIGLTVPEMLGGGHSLVENLSKNEFLLSTLLIFIIVKFLFTIVCYGSGVPGGIFLPLLALGALIGKTYGVTLAEYANLPSGYIINFTILAMAANFTAITRAPITGSILILEMTNSFNSFLELMVITTVAYLMADILNVHPIYDSLLERMIGKKAGAKVLGNKKKSIILEVPVCMGSELEDKKVKDIIWPEDCLIVSIDRLENKIIPNGDTIILQGDRLIIFTNEEKACKIKPNLMSMGEDILEKM